MTTARTAPAELAATGSADPGDPGRTPPAGLRVSGLDVDLGGRPVLRGVDLAVRRGELVGLIGPNGAGKTTLLRAVLGLRRPRAGIVTVDGRVVRPRTGGIGYVPQRHEFAWDFPISVERVVLTGLTARLGLRRPGVADWRAVGRALRLVRMDDLRERPVGELSGGQRQRVLVARALALDPAVLLLDEPFTGLDMPTQDILLHLFTDLAREDRAVLMTTHDILSALYSCDRVALLNRRIVATGSAAELRDPAPWTETFGVGRDHPLLRLLEVD